MSCLALAANLYEPTLEVMPVSTVDSIQLEHGCEMICACWPFFLGLGLEEGHVETFRVLLSA